MMRLKETHRYTALFLSHYFLLYEFTPHKNADMGLHLQRRFCNLYPHFRSRRILLVCTALAIHFSRALPDCKFHVLLSLFYTINILFKVVLFTIRMRLINQHFGRLYLELCSVSQYPKGCNIPSFSPFFNNVLMDLATGQSNTYFSKRRIIYSYCYWDFDELVYTTSFSRTSFRSFISHIRSYCWRMHDLHDQYCGINILFLHSHHG